jgi:hypothetical protein
MKKKYFIYLSLISFIKTYNYSSTNYKNKNAIPDNFKKYPILFKIINIFIYSVVIGFIRAYNSSIKNEKKTPIPRIVKKYPKIFQIMDTINNKVYYIENNPYYHNYFKQYICSETEYEAIEYFFSKCTSKIPTIPKKIASHLFVIAGNERDIVSSIDKFLLVRYLSYFLIKKLHNDYKGYRKKSHDYRGYPKNKNNSNLLKLIEQSKIPDSIKKQLSMNKYDNDIHEYDYITFDESLLKDYLTPEETMEYNKLIKILRKENQSPKRNKIDFGLKKYEKSYPSLIKKHRLIVDFFYSLNLYERKLERIEDFEIEKGWDYWDDSMYFGPPFSEILTPEEMIKYNQLKKNLMDDVNNLISKVRVHDHEIQELIHELEKILDITITSPDLKYAIKKYILQQKIYNIKHFLSYCKEDLKMDYLWFTIVNLLIDEIIVNKLNKPTYPLVNYILLRADQEIKYMSYWAYNNANFKDAVNLYLSKIFNRNHLDHKELMKLTEHYENKLKNNGITFVDLYEFEGDLFYTVYSFYRYNSNTQDPKERNMDDFINFIKKKKK